MSNMVKVYDADCDIIGQVKYNNDLDFWDGSNYTAGGVGNHLGITKLKDGRFVLIHGTQWQGRQDYAEVVSDLYALQEIIRTGHEEILEKKKFSKLKELYEKEMLIEDTVDEEAEQVD